MNVIALLTHLKEQGILINVNDGQLRISAPKGKLAPDLLLTIKKYKDDILRLHQQVETGDPYSSIEPVEEKEYYPLSSAQKRIYILQQMEPANTQYNILQTFPFTPDEETQQLTHIFKKLIERQ